MYIYAHIGPISYPGECDLMIHLQNKASFSHECILLPSYVFNMHQDTKSVQLSQYANVPLRPVYTGGFSHCDACD